MKKTSSSCTDFFSRRNTKKSNISLLQAQTSVEIHVKDYNDNAPVFVNTPYTSRVMEGPAGLGSDFVLTVTATDADAGNNSRLTFTFEKEYPEFQITTRHGLILAQVGLKN